MRLTAEAKADPSFASRLRRKISTLFALPQPERIVLTPGILIGLHLLFAGLAVRKLLTTTGEYHTSAHFPRLITSESDVTTLLTSTKRFKPDALLASLVTWKGDVLPLGDLFSRFRTTLRSDCPLLVADCTHAGAIGFPPLRRIHADVICGDLCKWITPLEYQRNLAFLWFANKRMAETARQIFNPFFLATEDQTVEPVARWIDPAVVRNVLEQLNASKMKRENIASRHSANITMAHILSKRFGLTRTPESSIVWIRTANRHRKTTTDLENQGLVWRPRGGGVRIICRSEEYTPGSANGVRVKSSSSPNTELRRFETIEADDGGALAI